MLSRVKSSVIVLLNMKARVTDPVLGRLVQGTFRANDVASDAEKGGDGVTLAPWKTVAGSGASTPGLVMVRYVF
jgi:hypothetical protein